MSHALGNQEAGQVPAKRRQGQDLCAGLRVVGADEVGFKSGEEVLAVRVEGFQGTIYLGYPGPPR